MHNHPIGPHRPTKFQVVRETLAGRHDQIKQYTVAVKRRDLGDGLRQLRGCYARIVLRESQTPGNHPDLLHEYALRDLVGSPHL